MNYISVCDDLSENENFIFNKISPSRLLGLINRHFLPNLRCILRCKYTIHLQKSQGLSQDISFYRRTFREISFIELLHCK